MLVLKQRRRTGKGVKLCPNCQAVHGTRTAFCGCGFSFAVKEPIQNYFPLVKRIIAQYFHRHGIICREPIEDTEEFAEAIYALSRAARRSRCYDTQFSTGVWRYVERAVRAYNRKQRCKKRQEPPRSEMPDVASQGLSIEQRALVAEMLSYCPRPSPGCPQPENKMSVYRPLLIRWLQGETYTAISADIGMAESTLREGILWVIEKLKQRFKGDA